MCNSGGSEAMLYPTLGLVCLLAGSVVTREIPDHARTERQSFNADSFMEKFGYLEVPMEGVSHDDASRAEGIREFQRFNGLPVSGHLDRRTIRKMQAPRCGLPDVERPSHRGPDQPLAFHVPGYKWQSNSITYKVVGFTRKLRSADQRRVFQSALSKWSDVTPLTFQEVSPSGSADIEIKFARYNHGDGVGNAFDGRGGTLAHAFFPGRNPISGDTHFDDDEDWSMTSSGSNLEIVAAHEFGHALGLGHSRVPNALMAPYYRYVENFGLHQDDKRGIQTLYGSGGRRTTARPRPTRPTRRPTRPTRRPTRPTRRPTRPTRRPTRPTRRPPVRPTRRPGRPRGRHCNVKFDDIIVAHDGNTYAFSKKKIYKLDENGVASGYPKKLNHVYRRAPKSASAIVFDRVMHKTFFFKGRKYWRYTGFRLDRGYPKPLPSDFQRNRAALQWQDNRIYLFKNNEYTAWTETLTRHHSGYPRPINEFWRGLRPNIEAAFQYTDGETYFFKGHVYWKFDSDYARVLHGYPKNKAKAWMGCTPRIPK